MIFFRDVRTLAEPFQFYGLASSVVYKAFGVFDRVGRVRLIRIIGHVSDHQGALNGARDSPRVMQHFRHVDQGRRIQTQNDIGQ